jgi:hypothetical protein
MANRIRISTPIVEFLEARGMIPPNCHHVELHIPPNGAMTLRYEVFVTSERMKDLGQAFLMMADETVGT